MQPHSVVWLHEQPDADALREQMQRFWYSVYVEELGKQTVYADHARKRLRDPHVREDRILLALAPQRLIVGTCLVAINEEISAEHSKLYQIPGGQGSSVCWKLIVHKSWRQKTSIALDLMCRLYLWGLEREIHACYWHCEPYLVTYYQRMGFREHIGWIEHPEYGRRMTMVLRLGDHDHLVAMRSPLAPLLDRHRLRRGPDNSGAAVEQVEA
jgi:hypothetical protein